MSFFCSDPNDGEYGTLVVDSKYLGPILEAINHVRNLYRKSDEVTAGFQLNSGSSSSKLLESLSCAKTSMNESFECLINNMKRKGFGEDSHEIRKIQQLCEEYREILDRSQIHAFMASYNNSDNLPMLNLFGIVEIEESVTSQIAKLKHGANHAKSVSSICLVMEHSVAVSTK